MRCIVFRVEIVFLEKYEIGCQWPSICCWRTAPMAMLEASDTIAEGDNGSGWESRVASASASLTA